MVNCGCSSLKLSSSTCGVPTEWKGSSLWGSTSWYSWQNGKIVHCKYLPLSHTKIRETFLRLFMGQREVLAVDDFSVLSWRPVDFHILVRLQCPLRSKSYAQSVVGPFFGLPRVWLIELGASSLMVYGNQELSCLEGLWSSILTARVNPLGYCNFLPTWHRFKSCSCCSLTRKVTRRLSFALDQPTQLHSLASLHWKLN